MKLLDIGVGGELYKKSKIYKIQMNLHKKFGGKSYRYLQMKSISALYIPTFEKIQVSVNIFYSAGHRL